MNDRDRAREHLHQAFVAASPFTWALICLEWQVSAVNRVAKALHLP